MNLPMPCCLHDTHLEPPSVLVDFLPVGGLPVYRPAGGRTSNLFLCFHLLCLLRRFAEFSRDKRPYGSLPVFTWDDVAISWLNPYPPHYRMAFAFSTFPYPPSHRRILRCAFLSQKGLDGFTMFRLNNNDRLGSLFSPVALVPMTRECRALVPATFLLVGSCAFVHDPLYFTTFIKRSHLLTILSILAPTP
jgi:hypothetical protein